MSVIKVKTTQFSGTGKVFSREPNALAAIIRGLAVDLARAKVEAASVHDFINNSGGTPASAIAALPLPSAAIDATTAGGAQAVALNTDLTEIQNDGLVMVNTLNEARTLLGLPALSSVSGVQAAADTIAALALVATAGVGAAAASFSSTVAAFKVAENNLALLVDGMNDVLIALGVAPLAATPLGQQVWGTALATIPAAVAVAVGPGAVAATAVTAFLAAYANNVATMAVMWNAAMNQGTGAGAGPLHVIAG